MHWLANEPLSRHTTLRAGGPARFFVEAASLPEALQALEAAAARRLPVALLGGGSNVLAPDAGFPGLTIRIALGGIETGPPNGLVAEVTAGAGVEWDDLVARAANASLWGLENLSLIPGTVGGAVIGNIGAYGAEVRETLAWAEALDVASGTVRRFTAAQCQFGYRTSWFKTPAGRGHLLTRAAFRLSVRPTPNLRYREVQDRFAALGIRSPSLAQVRQAIIDIRRRKLPDPQSVGTAGSFFKNPVLTHSAYEALAQRHPGLPGYPEEDGRVKVPLGWILDKVCGLRGKRSGRVGTHPQQALVLVNEGGSAAEIEAFAGEIAREVRSRTGLEIEWEVERLAALPALP